MPGSVAMAETPLYQYLVLNELFALKTGRRNRQKLDHVYNTSEKPFRRGPMQVKNNAMATLRQIKASLFDAASQGEYAGGGIYH